MRRKILLAAFVSLIVFTSAVSAYTFTIQDGYFSDGFEDGDIDEWDPQDPSSAGKTQFNVVNNKFVDNGTRSLQVKTGGDVGIWTNQSFNITTNETFTVEFSYRDNISSPDGGSFRVWLEDPAQSQEVRVIAGDQTDQWSIRGSIVDDNGSAPASIDDFTWHEMKLTVDYQEERAYLTQDGETVVNTSLATGFKDSEVRVRLQWNSVFGSGDTGDFIYVDDVVVTGDVPPEANLTLTVEPFMEHGTSQGYEVKLNNESGTFDVTEDANVTSSNTSILSVNNATDSLTATSDVSVAEEVRITATYQGSTISKNVTVASVTADNLDILPSNQRIESLFNGDKKDRQPGGFSPFALIIVAVIAGIGAANISSAFGGIGAMQFVFLAGWFAGYLGTGLMLVTVFYAVFVGLNLAGNVNMSMRG